jgi:glycosyltransferase involved in cell wall biosynthesis
MRPAVSVIVPFAGADAELDAVVRRLEGLRTGPEDELLVADNRPRPAPGRRGPVNVLDAAGLRSPAFARNAGARAARGEWLVFVDADTTPRADLLDAYFASPPGDEVAVLGGGIEDVPGEPTRVARYVVDREKLNPRHALGHPHGPFFQTANCAVRRRAFEQVGGFVATARAAEDADLCWRLQDAGWRLEERPAAAVEHRARATLPALLRQLAVHGAGVAWLNRRYPGSDPPPSLRQLLGRLRWYPRTAWSRARRGDREEALFVLIDLVALYAYDAGRLRSNDARR